MHPSSLKTSSFLLGAALAGLAGVATEAEAATVVTETTDFSNSFLAPTDLTSTWADFVSSGGIAGVITPGTSDFSDYVLISAPANTLVSIPFSVTSTTANPYFGLSAFNGGSSLAGTYLPSMPVAGDTYTGTLNFTMPASGQVTIGTSHESAAGTINYTIGATVPEAGSSVLGLAGMAAAALRRRRKDS
ncbi:MAG: hypothetical protein EOP88_09505 [Verrucomicrobiaceae bacterium]|nr:MAG: hypothetical protein EOP88_09505 [Verrucomicrobiaceae bacterium]